MAIFHMRGTLLGMLLLTGQCGLAQADNAKAEVPRPERWVASWGTAQMIPDGQNALPADKWRDATLRQVVRLSIGGERLRVRISNVFGSQPLIVNAASVGLPARAPLPDLIPDSLRALSFSGRASVMIPAGTEAYSDPVELRVGRAADLAISLHFKAEPARQTGHPGARSNNYVAPGNLVMSAALPGAETFTRWYQIADVEVAAPASTRAVVAIGDSITDGYGVAANTNTRWTDWLAKRMAAGGLANMGVVNAGIGGGRMLRDGLGPNLASRFDRDVLARSGVSHAIVLIGVNDMGGLHKSGQDSPEARQAMLDDLKDSYRQLAERAHAHGVCLIGGTMTPYAGSGYYSPGAENEKDRQAVNAWIRSSPLFDGVADFDAALRDPAQPDRLLKAVDNDGLHPSAEGYRVMADAVPLQQLAACRFSPAPAPVK
ncbi:MAG: SGNH/GDSL hydrolase family protein [Massilia sp.]